MAFSVLVLTYNEEQNIGACLESLRQSAPSDEPLDIAVLDSGSTDETIDRASQHGVQIYTREFDTFAAQRNWGQHNIPWKYDWILHLDADERVNKELIHEIKATLTNTANCAYLVPNRLIFMKKWIRHASGYPRYQARLLHRSRAHFVSRGHGQYLAQSNCRVGHLRTPYDHHNFSKGISDWVNKHNRYSSQEALERLKYSGTSISSTLKPLLSKSAEQRQQAFKKLAARTPFRPLTRFLYNYIWRMGFLDGSPGLAYCSLLAFYEYLIDLKTFELRNKLTAP